MKKLICSFILIASSIGIFASYISYEYYTNSSMPGVENINLLLTPDRSYNYGDKANDEYGIPRDVLPTGTFLISAGSSGRFEIGTNDWYYDTYNGNGILNMNEPHELKKHCEVRVIVNRNDAGFVCFNEVW